MGSKESTWLSAFFREHLGSGFSITDVDFFVTKHSVFIEEKGFIINGCGLLGDGQFRSFAEIKNDICMNIELKIVVIQDDDFYVVDFNSIDPNRKNAKTKWGEMIEFDLGPKYSREEIVRMYK